MSHTKDAMIDAMNTLPAIMGRAARKYIKDKANDLGISDQELAEMERGTEVKELKRQKLPDYTENS